MKPLFDPGVRSLLAAIAWALLAAPTIAGCQGEITNAGLATGGRAGRTTTTGGAPGTGGGFREGSGGAPFASGGTGSGGTRSASGGGPPNTGGAIGSGGAPADGGVADANGVDARVTGGTTGTGGLTGTGGRGGPAGGASGGVLAFPGAVGVGRLATGGRRTSVFHVTNLSDSGAGSFRDAVSAPNRFIVFDVGGYVTLLTPVSVKSNLTIAGQTAPGDGIGFMAREVSFSGSSNVIVRYARFRQGDLDPDASKSGINLLNAHNLIFDHVSIEFAQWNNVDSVGASTITFQHSISADPIGQQFAAHTETGPYTWYGNLFANAHNRCPLAKANTQFVNNVVYNYQAGYTAGNTGGVLSHDLVHNYFISGPSTTNAGNYYYQLNQQMVYINGNFSDSNHDGTLNGTASGYPGGTTHLTTPWSPDTAALATTSAADTFASVTAGAGASLHRDQVDALVIADVMSLGKAGKMWTHQTDTGLGNQGYGALAGGAAPVDSDRDGMPDAWETKYGLDPHGAADAMGDFDNTGYTNIEKYANGIADGLYP